MYRLLATDMDSTILVGNEIPEETIALIELLYQKGVLTALVTGRMVKSPIVYSRLFSFPMPVIACNGGVVLTGEGETLAHYPLPLSLVEELILFCQEEGAFFQFYNRDALYMSGYSKRTLDRYSLTGRDYGKMQAPIIIDDNPIHRLQAESDIPVKFVIMEEDEQKLDVLRREVEKREGLAVVKSHYNNLEITREEATKGKALRTLAHHLQISLADCVAVGDHENDISMFDVCGLSIGVEGNSEIAMRAADVRTPPPEQGGWNLAVRQHVLEALR